MLLKTLSLAPIIIPQALWTVARAERLLEAPGNRSGVLGNGPVRRLLILGDSSAAGVGAAHQSEALSGRLAAELAQHFTTHWKLAARSGATVSSTLKLLEAIPPEKIDFVIIALGVNDTKNAVSLKRWQRGYRTLLTTIANKFDTPAVCVSGVPPLGEFPVLPTPLNSIIGDRAALFDAHLGEISREFSNATHLPMDFPPDPESLASDGFHPGPAICAEWARRAAAEFLKPANWVRADDGE
ncbi:MAG: SGNH/GDSL hydrolase family protein [Pseudomonadota bacterium]